MDTCSFIQSWFYFGLLQEAGETLDVVVDPARFLSDDKKFVSTDALPEILLAFGQVDREEYGECLELIESIINVIVSYAIAFQKEEDADPSEITPPTPGGCASDIANAIMLSISCLIEQFQYLLIQHKISDGIAVPYPRFLHERMSRAGWCKYEISLHDSPICLYYLSFLPRHTHDVSRCTNTFCINLQINETTYSRPHATSCTQVDCHEVVVEDFVKQELTARPISQSLLAGTIPVIQFTRHGDLTRRTHGHATDAEILQFSITRLQDTNVKNIGGTAQESLVPYVAISHVWSE